MSADRPGRKRLAVDIPDAMHNDLKYVARKRNITITKWILRVVYARLKDEKCLEPYMIGVDK